MVICKFAAMNHFLRIGFIFLMFWASTLQGLGQKDWSNFEKASFKEIFVEQFFSFKSVLEPTEEIMDLEGEKFEITGYFIPVATADSSIILSKTPFASCFFCGSAGQETVIDVRLKEPPKRNYVADHKIKVRGTLRINSEDWETLAFILEDAVILED